MDDYKGLKYLMGTMTLPASQENVSLKVESEEGQIAEIIGITKRFWAREERAYGYLVGLDGNASEKMILLDVQVPIWKVWIAPDPKPHWPALYKQKCDYLAFTKSLFATEAEAKVFLRDSFIRLAKELPPIMF